MPFDLHLDLQSRLVRVRLYGAVTDADLMEADAQLRADSRFEPDFDQLVDTRDAETEALSPTALRELATRPPLFGPGARRAIVVRTDLGYGLARIFQARRGDVAGEIQIFRSLEHAELWLGSRRGG